MLSHVLPFVALLVLTECGVCRGISTTNFAKEERENEIINHEEVGMFCPMEYHRLPIFARKCSTNQDCKGLGEICCKEMSSKICRQGVFKHRKEPKHAPFLPGIPRVCPTKEAVVEVLPVKNCTRDKDCTPRICCPGGKFNYCRTGVPKISFYPRIMRPLKEMMSYLQCTSPPPPLLDLFPKPCKNSLDCFPNLCCQEKGKKLCRPAKRSLFAALT